MSEAGTKASMAANGSQFLEKVKKGWNSLVAYCVEFRASYLFNYYCFLELYWLPFFLGYLATKVNEIASNWFVRSLPLGEEATTTAITPPIKARPSLFSISLWLTKTCHQPFIRRPCLTTRGSALLLKWWVQLTLRGWCNQCTGKCLLIQWQASNKSIRCYLIHLSSQITKEEREPI